jgi:hypothetical protein
MTTTADLETWASALYAAYASGDSPYPIPPLAEQIPTTVGRWRAVADAVLARMAPDLAIGDQALVWHTVTKALSHAPDAAARVHADQELAKVIEASGRVKTQ